MIKGFVKASERLPDEAGLENEVIVKYGQSVYYGCKNYDADPKMYIETNKGSFLTLDCEWLDESIEEQPGEKDQDKLWEEVNQIILKDYASFIHLQTKPISPAILKSKFIIKNRPQ